MDSPKFYPDAIKEEIIDSFQAYEKSYEDGKLKIIDTNIRLAQNILPKSYITSQNSKNKAKRERRKARGK